MRSRALATLRVVVAIAGTLPCAVLVGIAMALWLPCAEDVRWAVALVATFPLWSAAICAAYLDERVWRAALVMTWVTVALLVSIRAFAQDEPRGADDDDEIEEIELSDVIVTATSEAEELEQSADSVRVVETDQVRAQSADMGEVLARSEGVSMRRAGGLGSDARLCIHGICDAGIRYFVDGVPLELAGFGLGVSNVPVNMIERVEIYRGAVPVRLGTDALGGVINLVRPSRYFVPHVGGYLQTGSWGTYRLFYDAGLRHDESGFYAGVSAFVDRAANNYWVDARVPDARGRLSDARVMRSHDAYEAYGIGVEAGLVGVELADRLTVRGFVSEYDRDLQHNVVMTDPYGEVVFGEVSWGGVLRYEHEITRGLSIDAFVGYTRRDISFTDASPWIYDWFGRRVAPRPFPGEIAGEAKEQSIGEDAIPGRLNLCWQIAPEHTLHLNITPNFATRSGDERIESNPGRRDPLTARRELFTMVSGLAHALSFFDGALENQVFLKDYVYDVQSEEVRPGFMFVDRHRSTHDLGFGNGLRWRVTPELFLRGSYEYATRLPDSFEVFGDGVFDHSQPELVPERSHNGTLEVSLDIARTAIGAIEADASGFVRWRQNMIVLLGSTQFLSYQNVYEALAVGAEISGAWTSPGDWVAVTANATYLEDRNTSTEGNFRLFQGDRIPNRPFFLANFSAEVRLHDFAGRDTLTLGWRARYVHEFFRAWESLGSPDTKHTVPSQFGQDLALTYTVQGPPRVSTTLEVTNLGDEPLFDFFRVQRPGRSFYLKVSIEY